MLYKSFQAWTDFMSGPRWAAEATLAWRDVWLGESAEKYTGSAILRSLFATLDVFQGAKVTHERPAYAIDSVLSGNALVPVVEDVALDLPFGDLLHFAKPDVETPQ